LLTPGTIRGLLGSAILALASACVFTALTLYGVISVEGARILLVIAWLICIIGTIVSEVVWGTIWPRGIRVVIGVGLVLGLGFWRLDGWAVHKRAASQDNPQLPPAKPLSYTPPMPEVPHPAPPLTKHLEHPSGFLQFDKPVVTAAYDTIAAGKQFGMNMRSRNNSHERVLRAFAFTRLYIETAEDQSDEAVLDKFSKEVREVRRKYISGAIKGPEVPSGTNGIWGTLLTHPLTESEAEGIVSKKLRLYYVSWLAWTDLQHRMDWSDDCRWLQVPDGSGPHEWQLVWHFCHQ